MGILQLNSTNEAKSSKATVLLYGDNGSGKTAFASTWPDPVFLVPYVARNEMKTLAKHNFPVVYFDDLKELKAQVNLLGKEILSGKLRCGTIVVDNLTAIQMALEEELKTSSGKDKLEWSEWGKFTSVFAGLLSSLHKLPPHIIWVTHSRVIKEGEDKYRGGFTLTGKSRELIPGFADMILYTEVVDMKKAGLVYRLHLKSYDIWASRIRGDRDEVVTFPAYIDDPSYDKLAELLKWPTCAEAEAAEFIIPEAEEEKPSR